MIRAGHRVVVMAAVAVMVVTVGCESDEFDDAPTATASSAGDGESAYGSDEAEMGSAGPIQGSERPPGHPTLRDGDGQGGGQQANVPAPQVERPGPEDYGQAGPIRWEAPSDWEARMPSNEMRFAEYAVDAEGGTAEVVVFYFGPGGAGGVDANIERWASQLQGGPEAVRDQRDVDGMTVHTVDASGTYHTDMPMGGGGQPREDQRLLGAIAEASDGLFFFRLLGDEQVVTAQEEAFDAFVASFEDGG